METWFGSFDPSFMFLLALPFIVAIAALVGDWIRHRRHRRPRPFNARSESVPFRDKK